MLTAEEYLEEYKMIHEFHYDNSLLKTWITVDNYINYFRSDWNVLMEVVEKVQTINDCTYCITIDQNNCKIWSEDNSYENEVTDHSTVEATYNAIINFIKWYNER